MIERDADIVERHPARIVEMAGEPLRRGDGSYDGQHGRHLFRAGAADRVAEAHLMAAEVQQLPVTRATAEGSTGPS
ncbi:hypothetical protein GCM10023069_68680 [Shinella granuli]